ncbi:MAG: heparinase II/III family protein [Alphaproteobacteria bacterium]|nr:heparinase II/III family protein [Alphaproteobacteria bacterium]
MSLLGSIALMRRLGVGNVVTTLRHRRRLTTNYFVKRLPITAPSQVAPFWDVSLKPATPHAALISRANAWAEHRPVTWLHGVYAERQNLHWSQVAINDVVGQDVKHTWNSSRFEWVTQVALAALHSEEPKQHLNVLHALTNDWLSKHDYQAGVLWSCSHEVAIRGLHLMLTTSLLNANPTSALLELLQQSYSRVRATLPYAIAQQNHHSFTEILFLFYVERFLSKYGVVVEGAPKREQVMTLIKWLIQPDGSCAMPSLSYHRVFCDIASLCGLLDDFLHIGLWRGGVMRIAVTRMCKFLESVIEPVSGRVPNIGLNDGSLHCLQFTSPDDYVPSLLLMSAVFQIPVHERFKSRVKDVYLYGRSPLFASLQASSRFDDFGLIIVDKPAYRAYLHYPRSRFRPMQQDFLHLDLWVNGVNVLHDSGTFSFNPTSVDDYDDGVAHNAPVPLDKPFVTKRSPYLYRYWPNAQVSQKENQLEMSVSNHHGVIVTRKILFGVTSLTIEDSVSGSQQWGSAFNFPGAMTADTFREGRWHLASNVTLMTPDASTQKISSPGFAPCYDVKAASCRILVTPEASHQSLICDIIIG